MYFNAIVLLSSVSRKGLSNVPKKKIYLVCLKSNRTNVTNTILIPNKAFPCFPFKVISFKFIALSLLCFYALLEECLSALVITALLIFSILILWSLRKRKKSHRARSGELGGCSSILIFFLFRNCWMLCTGALLL